MYAPVCLKFNEFFDAIFSITVKGPSDIALSSSDVFVTVSLIVFSFAQPFNQLISGYSVRDVIFCLCLFSHIN